MVVSQIRERLFTAFSDLHFEERRHIYTLDGIIMPSVSKKVEGHVEKVDYEAILPYAAAKASKLEGADITPDQLRKRWNTKRDLRCDIGYVTHSFMEHFNGSQRSSTPWQEAGIKFFLEMSEDYDVIFREIRMYTRKYWYAGTSDLLLIHRNTGHIIVADYKTNEDLFKNFKGKTLKEPFEWALENPYNKYQIQLSYYQIMLEELGLSVDNRWLVYLKDDGTYKTFNLIDLTNELKQVLNNKKVA